ncbi:MULTISPECIES: MFS transporter [unclassified Rhizobium]|uniref:MFS transporter n=1 Tax=unclassified Rhizobium TaxID=2613769 RepID=UPI0006F8D504|nr:MULTISPECIES: MFS transporter [unclassified Rhizobium]KQV43494.1 MFS transporter [Rhizobium sp. Root1212]KRD37679.1 MFS transporter [Rhizobium sp. Root268]
MLGSLFSVSSLMLSTLLMMIGFGLASYVLPVRSVAEGWSTMIISIIATGYTIGFTLSCIVTPKFVLKVGHVRVFAALVTLLSVAILLCGLVVDWRAWIVFRGMYGFAMAGSYLVIESWLNERVTNENRGMLFSVYLITTMIGTIGGQYLVPLGDPTNTSLFMLCSVLLSFSLLPTTLSSQSTPAPPAQARFNLAGLFRRSPVAVVGAFLAGAMAGAWLNLGGVFTQKIGLSTAEGATLLAAVLTGSAISQIPIGRASDRMDRRIVMVGCGVIGVVACLAMAFSVGAPPIVLYVIAGFVGSMLFPIYALNVAHANDLARSDEYVEVSSGMMITYGIGTISGPLMVGPVMDRFGPASLFFVLAIYFAAYGAYACWRIAQRNAADGLVGKTDFLANTVPTPGTEAVNAMNQAINADSGSR